MIRELEDYNWFPSMLRRFQMDYIGSLVTWLKLYQPLVPVLQQLTEANQIFIIQDICSGSGIPATAMQHTVKNISNTVLSDKYPDASFINSDTIAYLKASTDVLLLVPQPAICYTMYNGFHHFSNDEQKELVKKMAFAKSVFLFAEILEPVFFTMIKIIFASTLLQLFAAPFIQPFSLSRLFFTYIIPVNVFTGLYDGIISVMKSKSVKQYRKLLDGISGTDFEITVKKHNHWKGSVVSIKGNPVQR